jgi:hypothetical protein
MIADTNGQANPSSGKFGKRAVVDLQEFTSGWEEGRALRRKLYGPGRPLDKPEAEPLL